MKFNIQESVEVKKFLGVYYEWVHDEKGPYAKINMEKDVNKLVKRYEEFIGKYVKVQKNPGAPGTTLSKS